MSKPLVSVLITTYNHEQYIKSAIEGCLIQETSFPYEIIIHDDASTDNTPKIIESYVDTYPDKLVPILQKENQYSKSRRKWTNAIISQSKGKYLARCEGDDYWIDPQKLEKQIFIMEQDPSISMCFTAVKVEHIDKLKNNHIKRYYKGNHFCKPEDIILRGGGFSDIVTTITRKDIYEDLPIWYDLCPVGDIALNLLAMIKGNIFYVDHVTAIYRQGVPGSWTKKYFENFDHRKEHIQRLIKFSDSFDRETDYLYHKINELKTRNTIINFLIYDKNFKQRDSFLYHRLSGIDKLEVFLFRLFSPLKLWSIYLRLRRYFKGY